MRFGVSYTLGIGNTCREQGKRMVIVRTSVYTVVRVFRLADDAAVDLEAAEDLVLSLLKIHYHLHDFSGRLCR